MLIIKYPCIKKKKKKNKQKNKKNKKKNVTNLCGWHPRWRKEFNISRNFIRREQFMFLNDITRFQLLLPFCESPGSLD